MSWDRVCGNGGERSLALGNQLDRGGEGEEDRRTLDTTGTDGTGWGRVGSRTSSPWCVHRDPEPELGKTDPERLRA